MTDDVGDVKMTGSLKKSNSLSELGTAGKVSKTAVSINDASNCPISVARCQLTRGHRPVVDSEVQVYISLHDRRSRRYWEEKDDSDDEKDQEKGDAAEDRTSESAKTSAREDGRTRKPCIYQWYVWL